MDMNELLTQVKAALTTASGEFSAKAEQAFKEAKASGDMAAETKASVDKVAHDFNILTQAQAALKAQLGEVEQTVVARTTPQERAHAISAGAAVIASADLAAFAKKIAGNEKARISIPVKAQILTPDLAPNIIQPDRQIALIQRLRQRLFVRDLLSVGRTTSNALFWVQQTGFTNAAKVVPEGTTKPYSDIQFTTKITPVTTIAHMFKASKQILDDFSQLQSLVDLEMRYGLKYAEEEEILYGDGTGAHLHGIIPQAVAYSATGIPAGATDIDALRWAMLQSQLARIPATGHVLHYTDVAKIEMAKDSLGRYIIGDPESTLPDLSLWGLPVAPTEVPQFKGKFLTGAFKIGAQLFDREDENVVISTENVDDFERNLISIRCEERLALAVYRPEAFIYGDLPVPV